MANVSRIILNISKNSVGSKLGSFSLLLKNQRVKNICTSSVSAARKFTEKHEWVDMNGKVGTIGISNYAQDSLGDIVYAQLPDAGSEYGLMDECGALESVKAASELYCPVSGKVVEKNVEVESTPGLINSSCYDKGWLFKVELTKPEELNALMDETAYDQFLKTQQD